MELVVITAAWEGAAEAEAAVLVEAVVFLAAVARQGGGNHED